MIDNATKQPVPNSDRYALHRFQRRLCDICIFVHLSEPRVFVGGGEYGFDGLVREADALEIAALGETYGIPRMLAIAAERYADPSPLDQAVNSLASNRDDPSKSN